MKTLSSSAGWRIINNLMLRIFTLLLCVLLLVGIAWGDSGRGRSGYDRGQESGERSSRWRDLPPERKQELQQRYEQFRRLPADEQQRIRQEYSRFRQLPEGERRVVKERWRQMTPDERKEYRRQLQDRGRVEQR